MQFSIGEVIQYNLLMTTEVYNETTLLGTKKIYTQKVKIVAEIFEFVVLGSKKFLQSQKFNFINFVVYTNV